MKTNLTYIFFMSILSILILSAYIFVPTINNAREIKIWITFINFPGFIIHWLFLVVCAIAYTELLQQHFKKIIAIFIVMGIFLPLLFYLMELKLNFNKSNPFLSSLANNILLSSDNNILLSSDNNKPFLTRSLFNTCTQNYFLIVIFLFSIVTGKIFYSIQYNNSEYFLTTPLTYRVYRWIFYFPIFALFLYFIATFILSRYFLGFFLILSAFCFAAYDRFNVFRFLKERIYSLFLSIPKKEKICIVIIFALAFVIRYLWGLRVLLLTGENFILASDDGSTYSRLGGIIAKGLPAPAGDALYWGGIGYWYFLGIIYRLFGIDNYQVTILIQSILGALVPVSIYYITKQLFNKTVAVIASILCIWSVNLIFLSIVLGMEALFIPLLFIAMAFLIKSEQNGNILKIRYSLLSGLLFGLAFCARQEIILIPLVIIICMFISLRHKLSMGKIIKISLFITLGISIPMLLIAHHNYINYGKFTFMTGQAATSFSASDGSVESTILDQMGFNPFKNLILSLKTFFSNPQKVSILLLKSYFKKGTHYLFVPNFGLFDPFIILNSAINPRRYFSRYAITLSFYALLFLILGFILSLRQKEKKFSFCLIIGYLIYTFSLYAVIKATNARHRGVLEPFFLMFMAYGMYEFYRWFKNKVFNYDAE